MADGLNRWQGLGNLGADPELRFTQGGTAVLNLRMGCTTSYLDGDERKERTEWVNIVVWGKRAEALAKFLKSGSRVLVEGEMRTSSYEKDGEKKYKTEIHASGVFLCDGKGSAGEAASSGGERAGARKPSGGAAKKGAARPAPKYEEPAEDAYPD